MQGLESGLEVPSVALTPRWFAEMEDALRSRRPPVGAVYVLAKGDLDRIVGFRLRQGILAEVRIPPSAAVDAWARSLPDPHLLVALDGLSDAENVGAVVRSGAAFGIDGVVTDAASASPFLRRAVRVSLGTVFRVPVLRGDSLRDVLSHLKRTRGTTVVATHVNACAERPEGIDWSGSLCLVMGSEEGGVSPSCLEIADRRVCIPMRPGSDSLNVAAAAAILLHEAVRARRTAGEAGRTRRCNR